MSGPHGSSLPSSWVECLQNEALRHFGFPMFSCRFRSFRSRPVCSVDRRLRHILPPSAALLLFGCSGFCLSFRLRTALAQGLHAPLEMVLPSVPPHLCRSRSRLAENSAHACDILGNKTHDLGSALYTGIRSKCHGLCPDCSNQPCAPFVQAVYQSLPGHVVVVCKSIKHSYRVRQIGPSRDR